MIEQMQTIAPAVDHAKELYALGGIITIQLGTIIVTAINQKRRAPERHRQLTNQLNQALTPMSIKLDSLSNEVQLLSSHVIGPDGQNGLRGEVREIKQEIKDILSRERDRLHGPYKLT